MKGLFVRVNPNPRGKSVGDCTIRAISIALNQSWDMTYWEICKQGFIMCDMPSANHVWGEYLETKGFIRSPISVLSILPLFPRIKCLILTAATMLTSAANRHKFGDLSLDRR